ncbi:leucyl aminopeptidase [Campylobacter lari]|uniref:Probable cytosol aminopeptidase n=1 Tax=Campylobacter lari NCTC 11845 TaxID=1388749 RepID=A0A0A8HXW5_CAMLA|nr:leucyl aminopeptidase [Campylobacter lari]AJD01630.1 leucyl aminopeptidase, peptidase M17 family [Campylobacter lari NCTC 11845]EAK9955250.1 leucyl aminopeptidase [Campylobacter lari]STA73991.1 leucyl aminopeptidase [Campylobacter lari]
MIFNFKEEKINSINADFEIILIQDKKIEKYTQSQELFKLSNYKGEGVCIDMQNKILYSELKSLEYEDIRSAFASAYKALKKLEIQNIKTKSVVGKCVVNSFNALIQGFIFGAYEFNKYKKEKTPSKLENIYISQEEINNKTYNLEEAYIGINYGKIFSNACDFAKNIVNEIPQVYTPTKMAEDAINLSKNDPKISCQIYEKDFLEQEKMQAFLAVNRASVHPPKLIHLSYKPQNPKMKVVFVGKGLTYDSGGLSLKPADYMLTMKSDKSGGAAVMAIIKGASELNLDIEVHSIIGATENMIGGNAYKPDDILISREGVSIEVRNTDAEGRLVLADCLSLAQDLKPDLLIDLATLTGACVVGLGEYTSAIMGNNEDLQNEFYKVSKKSGDLATILHFNPHLKELIKSNIADVSNTSSSRYGGAITAGLFLNSFIREEYKDKWLHLDIAGPAYLEKAWGYHSFGATGAGVRMCLSYLLYLSRKQK